MNNPKSTQFKPKRYSRVTLRKFNIQKNKCARKDKSLVEKVEELKERLSRVESFLIRERKRVRDMMSYDDPSNKDGVA